jgi:hypothetical protein
MLDNVGKNLDQFFLILLSDNGVLHHG